MFAFCRKQVNPTTSVVLKCVERCRRKVFTRTSFFKMSCFVKFWNKNGSDLFRFSVRWVRCDVCVGHSSLTADETTTRTWFRTLSSFWVYKAHLNAASDPLISGSLVSLICRYLLGSRIRNRVSSPFPHSSNTLWDFCLLFVSFLSPSLQLLRHKRLNEVRSDRLSLSILHISSELQESLHTGDIWRLTALYETVSKQTNKIILADYFAVNRSID